MPSFVSTLWLLDVVDGSRRAVYISPVAIERPSVSPDGKRVAYATGALEWDVLEISLPDGADELPLSQRYHHQASQPFEPV